MGPLPKKRHHQAFWAVDLKGTKSCRTQGESVGPYSHPSVCLSVPPWATEASQALSEAGSSPSELGPRPHRAWLRPHRIWLRPNRAWLRSQRAWPRFHRAWPKSHRAWPRSYRGNVKGTADHLLPLSDWLGATKHPYKRDCPSIH